MSDPLIIKHPLEECVSSGDICDLDLQGRNSLDLIMTMIGDMRFRRDSINGTCAQYFLLVDISMLQNLCVSAHIDCDKLCDHIRRYECAETSESKAVSDNRQNGFLVVNPRMEAQLQAGFSTNREANAIRAVQRQAENCEPLISHCIQ
jgi:hypothetical protein